MSDEKKKKVKEDFRSSLTDAYKSFDAELDETKEKDKQKKQEILEEGIERIEKKSTKELGSSKILALKILDIRQKAGMTQTMGTAGKVKTPILFGKDEFKQKLVRELLVIGTEELADIGSAITIANLVDYFKETRTNWKIRTGDLLEVLKIMEKKEVIPKRVDIGDDEVLIRFKPIEMSPDIQQVLRLSTGLPFLTVQKIASHLGWSIERAQSTLTMMSKMEIAVLDEETGNYYFPGVSEIY
ncbi:MAG: hypothetical protein HGN29_03820 [Asgard group archaeon]|nr:hypothetical protein [Asgard group archaeon]